MNTRLYTPVLLALTLLPIGCQRSAPSTPVVLKPGFQSSEPAWRSSEYSNIPFHLVPLQKSKQPRLQPTELVDKLFAGLDKDDAVKKLLIDLHRGANVTFRVGKLTDAELKKTAPKAPPGKGQSVFWAITNWASAPLDDNTEAVAPGRKLHMPVYLSWTHLRHLDEPPDQTEVLTAIVNDYLLRHDLGYQLMHGRLPSRLEAMPGDIRTLHEIRAALDKKIAKLKGTKHP